MFSIVRQASVPRALSLQRQPFSEKEIDSGQEADSEDTAETNVATGSATVEETWKSGNAGQKTVFVLIYADL